MRRLPRPSVPVLVYLLVAMTVAGLIFSLGLLLHRQSQAAAQDQIVLEELQEQNATIKDLLERQARNDADRQRLIDQAVADIAAEQYRALVAHDRQTEQALNRALDLLGVLDQDVTAPPQPAAVIPAPAPAPAPFVGPRPHPTAAPAPPPACEKAGRSGRCKK